MDMTNTPRFQCMFYLDFKAHWNDEKVMDSNINATCFKRHTPSAPHTIPKQIPL